MTEPFERHPRGGLYFEDFEVGHVFKHGVRRTVTQADNMQFCNMTLNAQPLHIDAHFCATETQWGKPVINSFFTLAVMMGIAAYDTTLGTTVANLGMSDVRFHTPLFDGDTINVETEVLATRESKSNLAWGIVDFHHRAFNQSNVPVGEFRRQGMMLRRPKPAS